MSKKIQFGFLLIFLFAACTPLAASQNTAQQIAPKDVPAAYKGWTRVNPEPLKIPAWLAALCQLPPPDQQARLDSPHSDQFSNIYVNPVGAATISQTDERIFPVGSVIVKEKLLKVDDKVANALGIMIKHEKGYNPAGGDWEYAYLDAAGNIQSGIEASQHCQACHIGTTISPEMEAYYRQSGDWVSRKARDSVFSTFSPSPTQH